MAIIKSIHHNVVIGKSAFTAISTFLKKNNYSTYFILCDENTLQGCLPLLITSCPALVSAEIIEIESGEESKSLEFAAHILQTLIENKAGKDTLLINLGGGVVSDLGGFAASIYKRGIDFINVPTSLLAMADACVGGKTGIDFGGIKNSVGTFTQPKGVFVNPSFLNTLPERHYKNGLAEIYKIALIKDATLWKQLTHGALLKDAERIITRSISLKNEIVIKDPYDKSVRKILNFGHTVGHAIEALTMNKKNELLHGEAIVIGMIAESHLAFQKKYITKATLFAIIEIIRSVFELRSIKNLSAEEILKTMQQDKKSLRGKLLFALISEIGKAKWDVEVSDMQIKRSLEFYNQVL